MSTVPGQSREEADFPSNEAATATPVTGPSAARLGQLASPDGSQTEHKGGSEALQKQDEAPNADSPSLRSPQGSVTASLPTTSMHQKSGGDRSYEIQIKVTDDSGSDFRSAASPDVTEDLKLEGASSTLAKGAREDGIGSEQNQSAHNVPTHKVEEVFTEDSPKESFAEKDSNEVNTPRSMLKKWTQRPAWLNIGKKSKVAPDSGTPASGHSDSNKSSKLEPIGPASHHIGDSDALLNSQADTTSAEMERSSQNPIEAYSEEVCDDTEAPSNKPTSPSGRSWRYFLPSGFQSKKNLPGIAPLQLQCLGASTSLSYKTFT